MLVTMNRKFATSEMKLSSSAPDKSNDNDDNTFNLYIPQDHTLHIDNCGVSDDGLQNLADDTDAGETPTLPPVSPSQAIDTDEDKSCVHVEDIKEDCHEKQDDNHESPVEDTENPTEETAIENNVKEKDIDPERHDSSPNSRSNSVQFDSDSSKPTLALLRQKENTPDIRETPTLPPVSPSQAIDTDEDKSCVHVEDIKEDCHEKQDDNHESPVEDTENPTEETAIENNVKEKDIDPERHDSSPNSRSNSVQFDSDSSKPTLALLRQKENTPDIRETPTLPPVSPSQDRLSTQCDNIRSTDELDDVIIPPMSPSPTVCIKINDFEDHQDDYSDGSDDEIRDAERVNHDRSSQVFPTSMMPKMQQTSTNQAPKVTPAHRRILDVLVKVQSTSLSIAPKMKQYDKEAQAFFQILHFIYDMLGRETLQGILFEHHVRVHLRNHYAGSLKLKKKTAALLIVAFNGLVIIGALSIMQKMNAMIFLNMLGTSIFFAVLMDACVDLVTCYILDYSLYDVVYSAIVHIKHRLEEHTRDLTNMKLDSNEIRRNVHKEGRGNIDNIDVNALKEYVSGFSASRHFFVSYKNMLDYSQDSIEKAYILSYTNPTPGYVNQWSQIEHDHTFTVLQKYLVFMTALLLKLPRTVFYVLVYSLFAVLLTIALGLSFQVSSNAPYVLLLLAFMVLWILLASVYRSSLDFDEVRPSSADTSDDRGGDSLFDEQLSEDDQEEMMWGMERRVTQSLSKERCFCCKESDAHMLHPFNPIKGSEEFNANERIKICIRCANAVCQSCRKSDTPKILRLDKGDGCTICVYCVENVCRKCKCFYLSKEIILRHSQHGRTICRKCKLMEDLQRSSTEKNEKSKLRVKQLLSSPTSRKDIVTVKSIGLKDVS